VLLCRTTRRPAPTLWGDGPGKAGCGPRDSMGAWPGGMTGAAGRLKGGGHLDRGPEGGTHHCPIRFAAGLGGDPSSAAATAGPSERRVASGFISTN